MESLNYAVKTAVFEGPLDLLLDLIEKRKLFVSDISLAKVTDDFIRYIEEHDEFPLSESAEFIVIASTLMLLKSRSLLPTLTLMEEETASIEELEERLRLYQKVKEIALELKKLYGQKIIFTKEPSRSEVVVFTPSEAKVENLSAALMRLLETLPKKEKLPTAAVKKIITLEEMILKLTERIQKGGLKMKFSEVYKKEDKMNVIVGFLAVLELVRRGVLRAEQGDNREIEIESDTISVPHYV